MLRALCEAWDSTAPSRWGSRTSQVQRWEIRFVKCCSGDAKERGEIRKVPAWEPRQHAFSTSGSELTRVTCVLDGGPGRE